MITDHPNESGGLLEFRYGGDGTKSKAVIPRSANRSHPERSEGSAVGQKQHADERGFAQIHADKRARTIPLKKAFRSFVVSAFICDHLRKSASLLFDQCERPQQQIVRSLRSLRMTKVPIPRCARDDGALPTPRCQSVSSSHDDDASVIRCLHDPHTCIDGLD